MSKYLIAFLLVILPSLHIVSAQQLLNSELLGRPTDNSVTVQLQFADSIEVRVQYGTSTGNYTQQTPWVIFRDSLPAEIVINNLQPNTQYYYRVRYRIPGDTTINNRPEYKFHTQRPVGEGFIFVVQADPHLDSQTDTAIYNRCLLNQLEDEPDFMVDLGDIIMSDKLKNSANVITEDTIVLRTEIMRGYYEKACHSVPLFIALGNHEGEAGWNLNANGNNVAVWTTLQRKKHLLNPEPDNFYSGDTTSHAYVGRRENYYTWQWGNAQFIVLDPYWYTNNKPDSLSGWDWTLGETQYLWLKQTLESSTADFKFVFAHQIIGGDPDGRGGVEFADRYEWGGNNLDGTPGFATQRPGWYKPIKDLLTENRVTIFFHGHDHFFAQQQKDCLIYQECPQPGHFNFSSANQAAVYGYLQGQILPNSGHLRVRVDSSGVRADYVRAYKAADETPTRQNKDISATYTIGNQNCYDSLSTDIPVLWNSNYVFDTPYHNPFFSETTIEINNSSARRITVIITDLKGNIVRSLLSDYSVPTGKFKVVWDGKSDQGFRLAAGIYQYTIINEKNNIGSGKLVLQN